MSYTSITPEIVAEWHSMFRSLFVSLPKAERAQGSLPLPERPSPLAAMIMSDAEPIANRNPLTRIDLTPVWPQDEPPEPISICEAINQTVLAGMRRDAANKIWKLVVQAVEAGGTCAPPPASDVPSIDSVYVAPEAAPVVYDGIYGEWVDTAPSEYCPPDEDAA